MSNYRQLDLQVLKHAVAEDGAACKDAANSAIQARIADMAREKFGNAK